MEQNKNGSAAPADPAKITLEDQREATLLKTGALQNAIFNSANFSSIATDARGVIQIFNVGAERMLGYSAAEVTNTITPADISDPQELIDRAEALSSELGTPISPGFEALVFKASRGIEDIYELTYIRKDGSRFPAVVSVTALRDEQEAIIGYLLIGTDNTARKQIETEQRQLSQRLRDHQFYTRSLFESNIDPIMTSDTYGIITDVNKQMEVLTGCTRDELIGAPFKKFFTAPDRADMAIKKVLTERKVTDYELTARARDGKETVVSVNATTFYDRDRKLQGVFAAARDITERKRLNQLLQEKNSELETLVLNDPLTGLANRRLLADRISMALIHARRNKSAMAVVYLDLDGFKQVNDTLGHGFGDALLIMVAERLLATVREEDTVGRLGGDEFVLALWHVIDADYAASVTQRAIEAVSQPFVIEGNSVNITISAGVGIYPDHGEDADALLKSADRAMYEAKAAGRNAYRIAKRADPSAPA